MIYTGLGRVGDIADVKSHGGADVAEVYGGINEVNPIYYKTGTITGQAPLSYKALSKPISDYLISGNTVQNGTPSPEAPVDVVGCGVRTENYFNIADAKTGGDLTVNGDTITKGNTAYNIDIFSGISGASSTIPTNCMVLDAGDYTIFYNTSKSTSNRLLLVAICPYTSSTMKPEEMYYDKGSGFSFTLSEKSYVTLKITPSSPVTLAQLAITSGSQSPTSYIPYGYKLPLTVNGTEYPIYLGQVQTTRKIKKLVLDGTENWTYRSGSPANVFFMYLPTAKTGEVAMSNAYPYYSGTDFVDMNDKEFAIIRSNLAIRNSDYQYESQFKAYLAAQYAAGTPVAVWYVLAEPETGIINEPLHKIGDYADTTSFAQAGVTIPTVSGVNTLTVDTTVKPSEIDLTGRIKTSGYGQLLDKNLTAINDSTGMPIFIRG